MAAVSGLVANAMALRGVPEPAARDGTKFFYTLSSDLGVGG